MKISRPLLLQHYTFAHVAKTRLLALLDKRDADLAHLRWGVQRRADDRVAAREINKPRRYLHLMVAERHLGPRPSREHVCEHLNGDLLDCRADNLQWSLKDETTYRILHPKRVKSAASAAPE